jgi:hypothetical protein
MLGMIAILPIPAGVVNVWHPEPAANPGCSVP